MRFIHNQPQLWGDDKVLAHDFTEGVLRPHTGADAARHYNWGSETVKGGTGWVQEWHLHSHSRNTTAEQDALDKMVVLAADGVVEFTRVMPWGNKLTDLFFWTECGDDLAENITVNIDIIRNHDDSVILAGPQGISLKGSETGGFPMDPMSDDAYLKDGDDPLVRITFNGLPTDDDGNLIFVEECGKAPCFDLHVHMHMRDLCYRETVKGCPVACCPADFFIPCTDKVEAPAPGPAVAAPAKAAKASKAKK